MPRSPSHRWARAVTRHWPWVLLIWILLAAGARLAAPSWQEIAYDGDFEYLPAEMSSVAGGRLLDQAFPGERSRSEIVLVLGRENQPLQADDDIVGLDLLRRLYHRLAEVSWQRAIKYGYEGGRIDLSQPWGPWLDLARTALDHSITSDERFYRQISDDVPLDPPTLTEPRMAIAYWDRAKLREQIGASPEESASDFEAALVLNPKLPGAVVPIEQRDLSAWENLLDVLSWHDAVIGDRLEKQGAKLAVLELSSELAAASNIATIEAAQRMLEEVRRYSMGYTEPGLKLLMTGSAAIGGETLIASRDAIRYTEWFTIAMILIILAIVYRAPLLVAIPVISIGIAVTVSTGLVAILTQWSIDGTIPGLDLRVFTTSRIFVVVILFGAGTDYCLFLIARLREEAATADWSSACRQSLSSVTPALLGSALTTIVGLGMLWIADFGKFHYTGPIIAICLAVGLLVCTTFTPAALCALGPRVFWPTMIAPPQVSLGTGRGASSVGSGIWSRIALWITRWPAVYLALGALLLVVPGVYGFIHERSVTYNLSSQLDPSAASRRGLRLLRQHFAVGETSPVTVLLLREDDIPREQLENDLKPLTRMIYAQPGVRAVRTADDPLGDFPPDREMSLLSSDAWRRRALQNHRIAQRYFFSPNSEFANRLARLDVVIRGDPFTTDTAALVTNLQRTLNRAVSAEDSPWHGASVLLAGTTPSIIDLRTVTLADNRRIKIAVVLAVFAVLILVIRRFSLCLYLIATVLVSYYATLGLTVLFFRAVYGSDFVGLDWKLPLFLFVILVAVGQDYNVYLVTRIVEEQQRLGWLSALRRAVSRTGGIITACGLVMAATFFSMTTSAWFPAFAELIGLELAEESTTLRGIVELGFALGLGVLIDTFYVRTILVPSFVAVLGRRAAAGRSQLTGPAAPQSPTPKSSSSA